MATNKVKKKTSNHFLLTKNFCPFIEHRVEIRPSCFVLSAKKKLSSTQRSSNRKLFEPICDLFIEKKFENRRRNKRKSINRRMKRPSNDFHIKSIDQQKEKKFSSNFQGFSFNRSNRRRRRKAPSQLNVCLRKVEPIELKSKSSKSMIFVSKRSQSVIIKSGSFEKFDEDFPSSSIKPLFSNQLKIRRETFLRRERREIFFDK